MYYRVQGVTIDTSALVQFSQDGSVSNLVSVTDLSISPDTPTTSRAMAEIPATDSSATSVTAAEEESHDDHLPQSFVPVAAPSVTQQEAVQQSVQQQQSSMSSHGALM